MTEFEKSLREALHNARRAYYFSMRPADLDYTIGACEERLERFLRDGY